MELSLHCYCSRAPPRHGVGNHHHPPLRHPSATTPPCKFFLPSSKTPKISLGFSARSLLTPTAGPSSPPKSKKKAPLTSALRALESPTLDDSTLDPLLANLTPKELTLVLKAQNDWRRALRVFRRMKSLADYLPNPIHYNVLLRTLGRARRWDELRLCWIDMAKDGVFPTNNTYATLIDVYGKAGLAREALLWLRHMRSRGVSPDEVSMNTAVRILKDSNQFDRAERLFKSWCSGSVELDCLDLDCDELDSDPSSPKHFLLTELFRSGGRPPVSRASGTDECDPQKPRLAATYNTLIDLYGKAGRLKDASDAFAEMLRTGVVPDTTTFNTMINICGSHGLLSESETLLQKMEGKRILPDTKTFNIFMSLYASVGDIGAVLMSYRRIRQAGLRPDAVSYRIILQVLCQRKMVGQVEDVIREILESGDCVDEQSLPVVMKMYIDEGLLGEAHIFFEKHCSSGEIYSKNYAAIMDAYAEKGLWKEAEDVFFAKRDMGCKKDIMEYNVMVKAYGKAKLYDKALVLFESMSSYGVWPDECTYNSLVQMLSGGDLLDRARELLGKMRKVGFKPRCETFSAILASHSRKGLVFEAVEIYQEMKASNVEPNEFVYGSLIDAFAEAGNLEEALHYFDSMEGSGLAANQIVLTSLIKAYSKAGYWKEAQELYTRMKSLEDGPDTIASNCMIHLYAGLGMVSEAKLIFDELRKNCQANEVSYATMIYLYKNMGMLDEAMDVAREVQRSGLLTDCASYSNVMASYAANGNLRDCGELLHQMLTRKILPDGLTFKTLFTVVKKGGMPPEAVLQLELSYNEGKPFARQTVIASLFSVVGLHALALESCEAFLSAGVALDSSAYNVAIQVYGASGEVDKALNLFMRMQDNGLKPDLVTYINLANCYGKARMVEGLKRIFSLLKFGEMEANESLVKALINAYIDAGRQDLAKIVDKEMRFNINMEEDDDSDIEDGAEIEDDESEIEDD